MKYVLIHGGGDTYRACIGIFDNANEAFGAAYLTLDESIEQIGDPNLSISQAERMEQDTGQTLRIEGSDDINEYVDIMFYNEGEDST